jgi:hypothetical protein
MIRTFKHVAVATTVLSFAGIMAAGCLDRPVVHADPNLNTTFITKIQNQVIDKVDLLFMVDNSASMGDKQTLLSLAVPLMIQRLVTPNCVDNNTGMATGMTADQNGNCPMGSKPEFPAVHDMHLGIVTSSLGGRGGDQCPDSAMNPANGMLSAHDNDQGELINRGGVQGMPTVENPMPDETSPDNFLAYFPGCQGGPGTQCTTGPNSGKTVPNNAITTAGNATSGLIGDFTTAMLGVHEHGCGFEAQNEAWYRFLVQPDPFASINVSSGKASISGIDNTILKQRADFLRPDSLLAVIVVTDENEEAADPLAIGGQGWAFDNTDFPGSPDNAAPEGTKECGSLDPKNPSTTGPNDPNCTSCAFIKGASNFSSECPSDPPGGTNGYYDPSNDALNVRFFHQKERFGLFAGYPTSRYIMGLQKTAVPSVGLAFKGDTDHEHDGNGNYIGANTGQQNCVNPIYAQNLPTSSSADLCHLQAGPRTPDLVYYAAIAGVPHQLLQSTPGDGTCPSGTMASQCPQKSVLTDNDWKLIMGNDPEHYDFSGADYHMIESTQERTSTDTDPSKPAWGTDPITMSNQSACPDTSADNCDPINGREFATNKSDLEFSCIFPLVTVNNGTISAFQKDCTCNMGSGAGCIYSGACDCAAGGLDANTQLCQKGGSGYTEVQINGKAYPSVREMIIAKAMSASNAGNQGIVSSICPINVDVGQTVAQAEQDPLFGYNPAVNAIIDRLKKSLGSTCVPEQLTVQPAKVKNAQGQCVSNPSAGQAPCLIMVQMPAGTPGTCNNPGTACNGTGLIGPGVIPPNSVYTSPPLTQDILDNFCNNVEQQYQAAGGTPGQQGDPAKIPVCAMQQLVLDPNDTTDCSTGNTPGWCYVTGSAAQAKGCPYTILFAGGMPPNGAIVSLQCLETGNGSLVGDAGSTSGACQ